MELEIKGNIDDPEQLEQLYQKDKKGFKKSFYALYSELSEHKMADFWKARLDYKPHHESIDRKNDLFYLILLCLVTGFLVKMPYLFNFSCGYFSESGTYETKNLFLILFIGLSTYTFLSKHQINYKPLIASAIIFLVIALYINFLPFMDHYDSIDLVYLHLPLLLWVVYGLVFIDFNTKNQKKRMDYIRYNGEIAILITLILIAGAFLMAITIGIFSAINLDIEDFYSKYFLVLGLVSSPLVATYIVQKHPTVTDRIAPTIANIFSPLLLITLIVYLISMGVKGEHPLDDRGILIIFNVLLLGVMALIIFSVSNITPQQRNKFKEISLFLLTLTTLIIDIIALIAIMHRLGDGGFTPNRTAVLGSNLLVLGNLIFILIRLYKVVFKHHELTSVEGAISKYLPVYVIWTLVVVFGFPLIFGSFSLTFDPLHVIFSLK